MNKAHILPLQKEHFHFDKVVNGKLDKYLDRDQVAGIYDDDESLKDIAQDLYEVERDTQGPMTGFTQVEKPDFDIPEQPVIRISLSVIGEKVYDALREGWVVDRASKEIDVEETIRFYENMINKGAIREDYAALLISNKDERLRALRGKLTLFRLVGKREQGFIQETDDAA